MDKPLTPLSDRDAYRLSIRYDAPDFVKDADVADALGLDPSRNPMYADPIGKRYPIHTKAATWMSLAAAVDEGVESVAAWPAVSEACEFFNLGGERRRLLTEKAALEKRARENRDPDSLYGWVEKRADGSIERRVRLGDADEIKTAAEWLISHRDAFAYPDRQKLAAKILARAADESVDPRELSPEIDKMAGYGKAAADRVVQAVMARAAAIRAKHAEEAAALDEMAESLAATPEVLTSRNRRIKLASMLDDVDRGYRLADRYAEGTLTRPEEVAFGFTAADGDELLAKFASITPNSLYLKEAIESTTLTEVVDKLGDDLAGRISRDGVFLDAEKIASKDISSSQRRFIAASLSSVGVKPLN